MSIHINKTEVEQWDYIELTLYGPEHGNPFIDVKIEANFRNEDKEYLIKGFYDGSGIYKIRFMPEKTGFWSYTTVSNVDELNGLNGEFVCIEASSANHGPVRVHNKFHFHYADNTPYFPFGTTCYAWVHQGKEMEEKTLNTLKQTPFNKIRMCVFPKRYIYNENEPELYPFEGSLEGGWDFTRFNTEFFRHFEKRILDLMSIGIEADIILFHPYDKGHWGFDRMDAQTDDRYLKYVISRFAAFRNVWWSLANEFDFMKEKDISDWDRFLDIIANNDPYGHLCSIHNGYEFYTHWKQGITHVSIQNGSAVADFGRAGLMREVYNKPIIYDEVCYEGDIERRWGNISAEEMVHRFWQGIIAGTYVTHGESYLHPQDIIWWAKGGVLHGQSPQRIAFLKKIIEEGPKDGINPIDKWQNLKLAGKAGEYFLYYFGKEQVKEWKFELPVKSELKEGTRLKLEIIDTWNMTITPVDEVFEAVKKDMYTMIDKEGKMVKLPDKPYIALRISVID